MAQAHFLIPGFSYEIRSGIFAGEVVTIVDNHPFPDGHQHARKIVAKGNDGTVINILPRQLDDTPVITPAFTSQSAAITADLTTQAIVDLVQEARAEPDELPAVENFEEYVPVPAVYDVIGPQAVEGGAVDKDGKLYGGTIVNPIVDPMDERLDHLRPSRVKVRRYIKRILTGKNGVELTDVEFLLLFASDDYRIANEGRPQNFALKGDTQSGKTFLVEVLAVAWAEALGLPQPMPIFTLSGSSGITDFDLFGQTTSFTDPETGVESLVWLPGIAALAAQAGGILYLDELNFMGERVTSSLHSLIDHRHTFVNRNKAVRKGGEFMPEHVTAHLDLWVIGTYNEGYRGGGKMNQAFHQRFEHILWDYDLAVEKELIKKSPTVRLLGEALRNARKASEIQTPVGTSALQRIQRNVGAMGPDLAMHTLLGMFDASERDVVQAIITDRSIVPLLNEELAAATDAV